MVNAARNVNSDSYPSDLHPGPTGVLVSSSATIYGPATRHPGGIAVRSYTAQSAIAPVAVPRTA